MKKFLTLFAVVAVAGAIGTASAMDRTGKIGLGFQESFTAGNSDASLGSWSVKYGFTSAVTGQFLLGFDWGTKNAFDKSVNFGARILYNMVTNENSAFYTGLGFGWNQNKAAGAGALGRALRIQVPLGWEFSFAGLPEVGFSAEVGIVYDYIKTAPKHSQISSVGGGTGGNLGLGVHYYF